MTTESEGSERSRIGKSALCSTVLLNCEMAEDRLKHVGDIKWFRVGQNESRLKQLVGCKR